jgi:AcrR family transcriptional regulator
MTNMVVGRRERKKEETRRKIFDAALQLFEEKGFEATTVDEITERADVAKGTFFNYFPKKESMLVLLGDEWLERAGEDAVPPLSSAADRIVALFASAASAYARYPALTRHVVRVSMEQVTCPEPDSAWQRLEQLVTGICEDGRVSGEFRSDLDPRAVFGVVASVFMGTLLWWVGHAAGDLRTVSLEEAVRRRLGIAFNGILAGKGA